MKHHALRAVVVACLLVVGAVAALLIVGPRVERRLIHKPLAPATVAPAVSCPGEQATMSCVLQHQAPPAATARALSQPAPGPTITTSSSTASLSAAATSIYGVDFGWGGLSASGLKAIHARFAASYLSLDPSKNWTRAAVNADHAAGIATVAVWEATATRAEGSTADGEADARTARSEAAALGNTGTIFFAVDCDCAVSQVTAYFRGVHAILGARAGVYGGYDQVLGLYRQHLVGSINWQTYAWSGGRWLPASIAPLEQYLNGSLYDNDRAIAADYGQWPYKAAKPANPHHYDWLPDTRRSFHAARHAVRARERAVVQNWDRAHCELPARRHSCKVWQQHLQLLAGRLSFIAHHTGRSLKREAKRPRWGALHYRHARHTTTLGGAFAQLHRRLSGRGVVADW